MEVQSVGRKGMFSEREGGIRGGKGDEEEGKRMYTREGHTMEGGHRKGR